MKQEKQIEKVTANTNCNSEEEQLNFDELMDVQGGQEDITKNCGLGCYIAGIGQTVPTNPTQNDSN